MRRTSGQEADLQVKLDDLVRVVRALSETAFRRKSPFHLSPCAVCGAPTFQYPCPSCRSWCDFSDGPKERARQIESASKSGIGSRENFCRRVEAAGGFGPWYFRNFKRTVAYGPGRDMDSGFVRSVDAAIERAATMTWPDPGEIWDAVRARPKDFPPEGYYAEERQRIDECAIKLFGADRVAALKSQRQTSYLWPEDCDEGRQVLATLAEETLEQMAASGDEPTPGTRA
jgi:hypothetical protein